MGIISMVITILISAVCGIFLLEKTKIKERLLKFDSENNGPIYEGLKGFLFLALNLICFGCQFASYFIFDYIIQGKYQEAFQCFWVTFIAGIVYCFAIGIKE